MAKVYTPADGFRGFKCPGCGRDHVLRVEGDERPKWEYNGNDDKPTFSPSILARWGKEKRCHSFVREGRIEFLNDCTHPLRSQTVALPDVTDD